MRDFLCLILLALGAMIISCATKQEVETKVPPVVFVIGDEKYRSEESMPMLAKILKRELGAKITLCYSVDSTGNVDPNRLDHVADLEALKNVDLMVMFTRFRALPKKQADLIVNYVESGKPVGGFRTSTHAFLYDEDSSMAQLKNEWEST